MMRPREWGRRWTTTSSSTRCRHRASAVVSLIKTFQCAAWPRVDCVLPCGINIYMCVSPDACRLFSVYVSPSCSDLELVFYSVGVISVALFHSGPISCDCASSGLKHFTAALLARVLYGCEHLPINCIKRKLGAVGRHWRSYTPASP